MEHAEIELESPKAPAPPQLTLGTGTFYLHAYQVVGGTIYFVPYVVLDGQLTTEFDAEVSAVPLVACLLSGVCGESLRPKVVETMLAERLEAFENWDRLQVLNDMTVE